MMRSGSSLAAALLLWAMLVVPVAARGEGDIFVAWISFHEAYEAFTRYPSSENAAAARAFLPESGYVRRQGHSWEGDAVAFVASNLDILERESRRAIARRCAWRFASGRSPKTSSTRRPT